MKPIKRGIGIELILLNVTAPVSKHTQRVAIERVTKLAYSVDGCRCTLCTYVPGANHD